MRLYTITFEKYKSRSLFFLVKKVFFKIFFNPIYLYVKYFIVELLTYKKTILLNATSYPNNNKIIPKFESNIGDDINYILIPLIFNKYAVPYKYSIIGRWLLKKDNVLFIGSIITGLSTSKSIIIGSGLSPDQTTKPMITPKRIECVRGPLTKQYLQNHDIQCPAVYGDPALVLPIFYNPERKKKYKIGFILHFLDRRPHVLELLSKYDNCIILDVCNYGNWKSFIDLLCSCELILSSSLHGLIFADTYNVPNVWTHFHFHVNPFKYQDYFLSVGRLCDKPFNLTLYTPIHILLNQKRSFVAIKYNRYALLENLRSCKL